MPTRQTLENFIALVESNAHDKAIEMFYTLDASIQENQDSPRRGRNNLVENERNVLRKTKFMNSRCIRPLFVDGDHVVIRWVFDFEWLDGKATHIEEIAYQHWNGEQISKEQFF